jgi:hypothetical protein
VIDCPNAIQENPQAEAEELNQQGRKKECRPREDTNPQSNPQEIEPEEKLGQEQRSREENLCEHRQGA